ncbi:hypothetical protein E2C01_068323 [Portunus trituberculatus]|uniref:Uncharacterized protein n=1 Tax=Portunus trituberculatus TaxID=210409 RepID=A0A5B7HW61_PORTR|nr:hypothetical protein [Portunus trituberculatus]
MTNARRELSCLQ